MHQAYGFNFRAADSTSCSSLKPHKFSNKVICKARSGMLLIFKEHMSTLMGSDYLWTEQ